MANSDVRIKRGVNPGTRQITAGMQVRLQCTFICPAAGNSSRDTMFQLNLDIDVLALYLVVFLVIIV